MTSTTDVDQYVAKKLWFIFCTSLALANFLFFFETTYYKWNINCIIQLSDEEQFQLCVVRGYFIYFNTLFCSSLQSGVTSDAVNRPWHLLFEQIYVHMGQTCCKEYITTIDSWCQNNVTLYIFLSSSTSPPRHFFCMLTVILKIKAFLLLEILWGRLGAVIKALFTVDGTSSFTSSIAFYYCDTCNFTSAGPKFVASLVCCLEHPSTWWLYLYCHYLFSFRLLAGILL